MVRTKPHKTSQLPIYKPLSPEQENAIDLLILGESDREAAEAMGVTREMVWHWRHEHPDFLAEPNWRRQALWAAARERLRALIHTAVDVIEKAVKCCDAKAAIELLEIVKLHSEVRPPEGPTDPDAILQERAQAQAGRELGDESPLQAALHGLEEAAHLPLLASSRNITLFLGSHFRRYMADFLGVNHSTHVLAHHVFAWDTIERSSNFAFWWGFHIRHKSDKLDGPPDNRTVLVTLF
jgi:hypothetical protein